MPYISSLLVKDLRHINKDRSEYVILDNASDGTTRVVIEDLGDHLISYRMPGDWHRTIWRGNNLGSSFTTEQKQAINGGSFRDLFIGDYWTDSNNIRWRIWDMDPWYDDGLHDVTQHHIVVSPDLISGGYSINSTQNGSTIADSNNVGFYYYAPDISTHETYCQNMFSTDNIISFTDYQESAYKKDLTRTVSKHTGTTMSVMNEIMVFGRTLSRTTADIADSFFEQFQAPKLKPSVRIGGFGGGSTSITWLRDLQSVTANSYCYYSAIGSDGRLNGYTGNSNWCVRTFALIGGDD